MRGRILLASIAAALSAPSLTQAATPVIYTVSPRFEGQALTALNVEIDLTADADGETRLRLPRQRMGHDHLWRNIQDFSARGATSIAEENETVRVLRSRPGQRLVVRYRIVSAIDHDPTEADNYPAQPWVRPNGFYVDAASALLSIDDRDTAPTRFRWRGWPKGFTTVSAFDGRTDLKAGQVPELLLIGGRDLRVVRADEVILALRGRMEAVPDDVLASELRTLLRAERGFFGETDPRPYLVAAATVARGNGEAFHGTGKLDAFGLVVTPGLTLDELRPYLAHEFFHAWNPNRLGGRSLGPRQYWFSEGFTDFYARRILAREGLITPQRFVELWNDMLRAYALSPVRTMSGAEAAKAFWTDPDAEKLPYQRGALLAALWDERLRAKGDSLDAVLRAQAQSARTQVDASPVDLFIAAMAERGLDVRPDIAAFAERGDTIALGSDIFAPCADQVDVTTPRFDLGFTPKPGADGLYTVTALRPGGPAQREGLGEGDVILAKLAGTNGDATRAYELKIRGSDGAIREVRFLPQGDTTVTYPQLRLRPEAAAKPKLCGF